MQRVRKNRATMYIRAEGNPDERRDEIVTREPGFLRTPNRQTLRKLISEKADHLHHPVRHHIRGIRKYPGQYLH